MLSTTVHNSRILRTDGRSGRFYDIPNDDGSSSRYPSVTTILGSIAKPALISWAAKEERLAVSEAAADLHAECARQQLPRSMYLLALEQRLGKTKAHVKALAKAAEIGTQAHQAVEWALKAKLLGVIAGPKPPMVEAAQIAFARWQEWAQQVALTPVLVEQCIWSRTHAYAGTLDHVVRLNAHALLGTLERQGPVETVVGDWLRARETATVLVDVKTGKKVYEESFLQSCAYSRALSEMGHGRVDGGLIVRLPKLATDPGMDIVVVPPARDLFPTFLAVREVWQWQSANDAAWRDRNNREVA